MRRSGFLSLVGLSSASYKNMVRHDQAPVVHADVGDDGRAEYDPSWTEYSLGDAVMTAIAVALNDEGLSKQTASAMVVLGNRFIKECWPLTGDSHTSPIYFGGALMLSSDGGAWLPTSGPLSNLTLLNRGHKKLKFAENEQRCRKLVISNLSLLRREIEQRALIAGLDIDITNLASL